MNHATIDNLDEIMDVFKQYKDIFPHIRSDKIQRMIESNNVVWEEKGIDYLQSLSEKTTSWKIRSPQKGDCILHQIAAKNQIMDGSGKRVFENFMKFNANRDIVLSVRGS